VKRKNSYDKNVYRSLFLITQFGINMIVPTLMMSAFGWFLDRKLHTSWIMVVFFFLGAIAGWQNVCRMVKPLLKSSDKRAGLSEKNDEATDDTQRKDVRESVGETKKLQ